MLEKIIKSLKSCKNFRAVSRATGIHINTLYLIRDGITTNPKLNTIEKLQAYFEQK